ncbi:hypothetical protein TRAPUB_5919 [Trametes pubescens]|uniref:F-box domain-containing protein n=1 Tax=Trametes pubescens TaxID=154538 RepID=A0A1M2W6V6_TRAPU|nr:hypothetical protein TRAPUB_5919 [Trametes pubescens]
MLRVDVLQLAQSDDTLTKVLIELRHCLNSLTPVDQIPPEILAHIFGYVLQLSGHEGTPKLYHGATERVRTRPLLALSHVSSKWRAVALNTPSLWTRIDNHDGAQLEAFIQRSGAMPLSLHLLTQDAERLDHLLQEEGHRIRRLDLTEYPHWVDPPAHLQVAAPLLECLTITSECAPVRDDESDATPILFGERVSNLRAFALRPLYMWIPGNYFPHLTHLYLGTFRGRILYDDTMRYLTSLFSNTPALQYLFFSGLQAAAVLTVTSTRAVLPSLRAFTCIDSDLAATLLLLQRVELPENVLVRLDDLHVHSGDPGDGAYLPCRLASERFVASFTRLEIAADDNNLHLVAEGPRSALWIRATCYVDDRQDQWAPWVTTLHAMLPLARIKTLHVSLLNEVIIPNHLLAYIPDLTALALRIHPDYREMDEDTCWGLLNELFRALSGDAPIVCPALESVGVEIWGGDTEDFRLPPASEVVRRMVRARTRAGKPLRRLALQPHLERDLESPEMVAAFRAALALIKRDVEDVELVRDSESVVCLFKMSDVWKVDAFEEYWELLDDERPRYNIPWL